MTLTTRTLVCILLCGWGSALFAQERLINEEPYDLLTIPAMGKETTTLKIYPIKLPNRRLPKDPKPTDKIRVRLLEDDESRDFEVMWRDVKKLEFFFCKDNILVAQLNHKFQRVNDKVFNPDHMVHAFILLVYSSKQRIHLAH